MLSWCVFFFSFIPSYFDSSCSSFVGVLCFIFAAIQTPFMPNCVSFRFKRKFCVCQNNVACSSRECSLFIHVFKSNRREREKNIICNLFHEVSTQKHLLNDFEDCRCANAVSISHIFINC